jgi:hypothetical protein
MGEPVEISRRLAAEPGQVQARNIMAVSSTWYRDAALLPGTAYCYDARHLRTIKDPPGFVASDATPLACARTRQ